MAVQVLRTTISRLLFESQKQEVRQTMRVPSEVAMSDRWEWIEGSQQGSKRSENRDSTIVVATSDYVLGVVVDGVSSAKGSLMAVQRAREFVEESHKSWFSANTEMVGFVNALNSALVDLGDQPFTTFSVLFLTSTSTDSVCCSFGDSRIYGVSNQTFDCLTVDDSVPGTPNIITRFLGDPSFLATADDVHLIDGDYSVFLLCSDGFYVGFEEKTDKKVALFDLFMKSQISRIKKSIDARFLVDNSDDSSYVVIRKKNV